MSSGRMPTVFLLETFLTHFTSNILGGESISKIVDKKADGLVNEGINAESVFVISETGEQLGKMSKSDAIKLAFEHGLDLFCVAPNADVPVCKFMDYSKYRYDKIKRAKEARKNQKTVETKEVRLSPTIDVGDLNTKIKAAYKFLSNGDKVKVSCRFRGRMVEQAGVTKGLFLRFAETLKEVSEIDQQPILDGKNMTMQLVPNATVKKK